MEEGEEEVDFQKIMNLGSDTNNKRKRIESFSSTEVDEEEDDPKEKKRDYNGRKTLSIDQSLFSTNNARQEREDLKTPNFSSCGSTIAMQFSQYDDPQTETTATCSQLDRVLMPTVEKGEKSPPVQQLEVSTSSKKPMSILTPPPDKSSLKMSPKPRRTTRVSFQQQPRVMLLDPSWKLSNEHTRGIRKCQGDFLSILKMPSNDMFDELDEFDSGFDFDSDEGRESFMAVLSSNRTDNLPPAPLSFYAVSTEKDAELEGYGCVVPRCFPYYLAIACGLPIVDIEFLTNAANKKRQGTYSHQRFPFPNIPVQDPAGEEKEKCPFLVIGATNHTWYVPEKAHKTALNRHSLWQKEEGPHAHLDTLLPGTDLLCEYTVLLLGEFDQPNHSKRAAAKRRKNEAKGGGGYCTRGNITLLLQLCGAKVYDIDSVAASKHIKKGLTEDEVVDIKNIMPVGDVENGVTLNDILQSFPAKESSSSNLIVMVKDKTDAKLGNEFLLQLAGEDSVRSQIPIVACQWLLDSIGDFELQKTDDTKYKMKSE